ncbi:MAG TPA: hypothetical protein DCL15_01565 [Chloroflexi bacterium]|nr:hypothetical protein [Chloroflexota bacterium]HHW85876.1 hypothetical protein [Chloroflexota bacterium]
MSERKKKTQAPEQSSEIQRELTRKEERLRQRDRERHRKLYTFVGIALGAALLFILVGVVYQFLVLPNQQVARVGDVTISANQFWKRVKLQQSNLQNQLVQYQQLEEQFGGQGFFTSQISQLQATLGSPFALGQQTLDRMLEELIVEREAAARGITVTDAEVEQALRDEVANGLGLVTEPQATATAVAALDATATAAAWTPTPTATTPASATPPVTESGAITATTAITDGTPVTTTATTTTTVPATATPTAAPTETPTPLPTPIVITETRYTEGLTTLQNNIQQVSGLSLDEYKRIIRDRLLREKLQEVIANETVTDTEEAVHARHILLRVREPEPTPTAVPDGVTPEPTLTPTPLPEGFPTPTPTPEPRDDAATLALANELRQRLLAGEDFATLAAEYSDDPGSAANGGDLGWFGKGQMVAPFEEAAFSLPIGEISEPVKSDFGYHLIEVLERDSARPKSQAQLDQERTQAFQTWLQTQLAGADIQRAENLVNLLPAGL